MDFEVIAWLNSEESDQWRAAHFRRPYRHDLVSVFEQGVLETWLGALWSWS